MLPDVSELAMRSATPQPRRSLLLYSVIQCQIKGRAMNLYLHGIVGDKSPATAKYSLMTDPGDHLNLRSLG
ncbi:MAG: hypothetical protein KME23_22820 [Goleter apudmare HA4340-LM2]|nr:hypothetical protein [Goleter apudmare HA4340-LM2]